MVLEAITMKKVKIHIWLLICKKNNIVPKGGNILLSFPVSKGNNVETLLYVMKVDNMNYCNVITEIFNNYFKM